MCKAPKPPKPKEPDKPEWLKNPYLDAAVGQASAVNQLRQGRSSLRIPLATGLAISGATPATTTPAGNAPPVHIVPPTRDVPGGIRRNRRYNER